jgi:hypothetical protein
MIRNVIHDWDDRYQYFTALHLQNVLHGRSIAIRDGLLSIPTRIHEVLKHVKSLNPVVVSVENEKKYE